MYGCVDGYYVYGFKDEQFCRDLVIDSDEIIDLGLEIFAEDVVRLHMGDIIYGITLDIGAEATEEEKQFIQKIVDSLKQKYKMGPIEIGYFIGLKGDFDMEHSEYEENE